MIRNIIALIFIAGFFFSCNSQNNPEITSEELQAHIRFMASDDLKGRYPGTPEDSILLKYLATEFEGSGLESFAGGFIQEFDFLAGIVPSDDNFLKFGENNFIQGQDFFPSSFSGNGKLSTEVEFCGYGFQFKTDEKKRDDYKRLELTGKWAMILKGEPEEHPAFMDRNRDRDKALLAMEKGAAGVLLITGEQYSASDDLDTMITHVPEIEIPVIQIKRYLANRILEGTDYTIEKLEKLAQTDDFPEINTSNELQASITVNKQYERTGNVLAYIQGDDPKTKEWIVIGAHHDHLGMGGRGSSSRAPDTIAVHNGADDNASGVAVVLEVAEYFASKEHKPSKNLVFVTFGAEEKGLLGSKYFVENSPVDLNNVISMINIDMLGRMKEDSSLQIGGIGTSDIARDLVKEVNMSYNFNLALSEAGYGPSDHSSFYIKNIPVYFFSTGAHQDYHTPYDDADSLNYGAMEKGTRFIADLAGKIDKLENRPEFKESGPKSGTARPYRNKITLGIMPDVSGESNDGMKVLAVTEGKPAYHGGMKKGDIITAIDGNKISSVYDYMYRLNSFKTGDRIVVTVKRNDKSIELLIQL